MFNTKMKAHVVGQIGALAVICGILLKGSMGQAVNPIVVPAPSGCEPIDLMIVLDTSCSIAPQDKITIREWILYLVSGFNIGQGPMQTRVAVIAYDKGYRHTMFLYEATSLDVTLQRISQMGLKQTGCRTRTDTALQVAREIYFTPNEGARPGVAKRLVLISDGTTRPFDKKSETLRQADELRKMGVRIVVMSLVNSYKPESDIEKEIEFNQITGGRGFNIIDTNNFGSLLGPQGPLPSLINAICAREDGTGNTVNPAGVTTTQAPIITNPPVIITTQAPFITNPPATTINPFQTTTVRGDPHVSCVLPSGDRICFDAYGDPGKTYLFFDDKLSRTKVLATFVSVEASTSSKDLLFVDTVYIQSQSINIIATISGTSILDHETGRETKLSWMKSHKSKHTFGNVKAEIENRYLWIESPEFGRVAVMKYNNHLDFDLAYDKSVVAGGFVGDICSSAFTKASMPTNKPLKFNSKHFFTGNHEIKNGVLTANGVSVDLTMRKGCYKPVSDTSKEGINRILEDYLTDDDDLK